jgi:carboxymethylenebutenolidase
VVIHEWWGLTDWVKGQAQELAASGYVTLAVDLYRGKVVYDPNLANELARDLPEDQVLSDLKAAFDYLASRPDVRKDKIGSVGWCMGGGFALLLAIHEPKLAACVVNYGSLPTNKDDIRKIHAPVLGNFGAEDRVVRPAAVEAFENAMKAGQKSIDVKIYDRAGHAFENPDNHLGYQAAAAENAWARTIAFLDRTLKGQ